MKEEIFNKLLDVLPETDIPPEYTGYFPSIEDIDEAIAETKIENLAPMLIFFAGDPWKDIAEISENAAYRKTVSHCKSLVATIPLEE